MTSKKCEKSAFQERFFDGPVNVGEVERWVGGVRGERFDTREGGSGGGGGYSGRHGEDIIFDVCK